MTGLTDRSDEEARLLVAIIEAMPEMTRSSLASIYSEACRLLAAKEPIHDRQAD